MRISFENLRVQFGQRCITERLSAQFAWGDESGDRVIALMGPSGSGKTTLAREILNARYGARDGHMVQIKPGDAVIAYLPQRPVLFTYLSLADNARLLERVGRYRERFDSNLFKRLTQLLRLDGLIEAHGRVEQLSGGESQRVMLLRTLSVRPDLVILDEPAAGLDPAVREDFLIDLLELLESLSINALYITHHWDEVRFLARRLAYAEVTQAGVIDRLDTIDFRAFADAPPTIDAFKTVYGPGCSIWPLSRGGLACFKPTASVSRHFRTGGVGHRIEQSIAEQLLAGGTVRAALYEHNRFAEWRDVMFRDLGEWN